MGWASGSEIADAVFDAAHKGFLTEHDCAVFALSLVDIFENADCDTMCECDFVQNYLVYNEDIGRWGKWEIKKEYRSE